VREVMLGLLVWTWPRAISAAATADLAIPALADWY
jgi:hypothetical protein